MAEGFLHLSHGASQISLEDVGDDYFHSLLANSFFQDVQLDELGDVETCKIQMHSSIVEHKHLRYLDLSLCSFDEGKDVSINQLYNLQTLVLNRCRNVNRTLIGIGSLKILRHLDLSYSDVKVLDDSVLQLTHLQTLDLSFCSKLVFLPRNIGCLRDLRDLEFKYCWNLKVLPKEFEKLTRLRCLNLSKTKIEQVLCISSLCNLELLDFGRNCKLPREIKNLPKLRIFKHRRGNEDDMPRGMETLTGLEVLDRYVLRKRLTTSCSGAGRSGIDELANLNSLQELEVFDLQYVRGGIDAERAKLKDKTNLRRLSLNWGSDDHDNEMVLEGLEPNPNLRDFLGVFSFSGTKLPKWMGSSSCLPNLVEIHLFCCNNCEKLPALGMLPCLKVLYISGMKSMKCLGEEFYCQQEEEERITSNGNAVNTSTAVSLFPSLISLTLLSMENLEEWVALPAAIYNSFPSLEKLHIKECPNLRSTPKSFSFLKELDLFLFDKGVTSIFFTTGGLTSLTTIHIKNYRNLYIPLGVLLQNITPNLQKLYIGNCPKFQGFVEDDDINNYINKDGDDNDVEEAVLPFSCPEINSNSNNTCNSLRTIYFEKCPVLTLLPDLRSVTSLRELMMYGCNKLKESIPYDLRTLTFLERLEFDFIQSEYEHPEDPADDKSLRIKNRGWRVSKKNEEDS